MDSGRDTLAGGFPHSEISGSVLVCQLPGAFRRLPRLSSPVVAKASTACAWSLDPPTPTAAVGAASRLVATLSSFVDLYFVTLALLSPARVGRFQERALSAGRPPTRRPVVRRASAPAARASLRCIALPTLLKSPQKAKRLPSPPSRAGPHRRQADTASHRTR